MDQERLRRDLERLDEEIAQAGPSDERRTALLQKLRDDIRDLLDHPDTASSTRYDSVRASLEDSVYHFDASHPKLAKTMTEVIDTLVLFNL
jgi:hypothetical protein